MQSSQDLTWGGFTYKIFGLRVGRVQFLTGYWTEDISFFLATGLMLPSTPGYVVLSIQQFITQNPGFHQSTKAREVEQKQNQGLFVT